MAVIKKVLIAALAFVTMAALIAPATANAQSDDSGEGGYVAAHIPWVPFSFNDVGSTAGPFAVAGPGTFYITDAFADGQQFEIFIDGVSVGTTSAPTDTGSFEADVDAAFASASWTSGTFQVPAGAHSITALVIRQATGFSAGGAFWAFEAGALTGAIAQTGTAVCIESEFVQNAPEAALLSIGNEFYNGDSFYMIIGDPLTCEQLPLGCPRVEQGLVKVAAIKACLPQPEAESVPAAAVPAAAAAPVPAAAAPAAASAAPVALATTGSTTDSLVQGALALIAVGAGASGLARRRRNR